MSDPADPTPPPPPLPWAAPAAPPFGVPAGQTPRYAPPPGYAAPHVMPVPPAGASAAPSHRASGGSGLGVVALIVALVAAVVPAILVSIATFRVGLGAGQQLALRAADAAFDWSVLTPVRGWVLLAEMSFWVGTVLGVWAIVQGLIAIVKNRGRGLAIAAVIVAVAGAIVYAIALQGFLTAGLAAGTGIGG